MDDAVPSPTFEGFDSEALAAHLQLPRTELYESVSSTLDVAHALARDGAPGGTLIVAEAQTEGRGRGGKSWASARGAGLWTAFILRPDDVASVSVSSLRVGLQLAEQLDALARETVQLKWPNDLLIEAGKLAGILAEARWRERVPEWVALGIGINLVVPDEVPNAAGLPSGTSRLEVLEACTRGVRAVMGLAGPLTDEELAAFNERHAARGREVARPRPGVVEGLAPDGALLIRDDEGVHPVHAGSLRYPGE